jgi:hypothetical protein
MGVPRLDLATQIPRQSAIKDESAAVNAALQSEAEINPKRSD